MRVTANSFPDNLLAQLSSLTQRQNRLQTQAATGQRIHLPEDDPVSIRRILDMQAEGNSVAQYQRNIARHRELANASFAAIKGLKTVSDRARELSIAADDLKSPAELAIYANEITELIEQAVQVANAKSGGDYLLAGTKSDQPPFVLTTDANGLVISVTYQGNTNQAQSEIASGVVLSTQAVGANSSGSGPRGLLVDSRVGADFFNHLISLQNNLAAANTTTIENTDRGNLAKDEENFLYHIGTNGAVQSRLETASALAIQRTDTLEALISKEADADLAQTLVKLSQTQTAYQAALQSAGKILNSSLLDYLR